jgi:hypothetical protein
MQSDDEPHYRRNHDDDLHAMMLKNIEKDFKMLSPAK